MTTNKIEKLQIQKHNLSLNEQRALSELCNNRNLIIKLSDKGGNTALLNRDMYISMCLDHLTDSSCYEKLSKDPTMRYMEEFKQVLNQALEGNVITNKEF
ncbi:Hypothetical predicted protein [Pelobates cultripes]|uniref:Uncharacterized protein n=1 Tax=Pelobates cultripes TaxID=61616 RepID=A0AAD1VYL8_PELCU|nr:Hypothetical predicted protein [Pelobates cultripes]